MEFNIHTEVDTWFVNTTVIIVKDPEQNMQKCC